MSNSSVTNMYFNIKQIILILGLTAAKNTVLGSYCEIFPPEGDNFDGSEFGFIFVPGAQIKVCKKFIPEMNRALSRIEFH